MNPDRWLTVRIGEVTHKANSSTYLTYTPCNIRWVLEGTTERNFPRGILTENPIDCMTCLVKATER